MGMQKQMTIMYKMAYAAVMSQLHGSGGQVRPVNKRKQSAFKGPAAQRIRSSRPKRLFHRQKR